MTWGKQNTEDEAHAQLSYALEERGINCAPARAAPVLARSLRTPALIAHRCPRCAVIDTAEMYPVPTEAATQGRTDRYIGSWLAAKPSRREKIILATKVSGFSERITWVRDSGKARSHAQCGGGWLGWFS